MRWSDELTYFIIYWTCDMFYTSGVWGRWFCSKLVWYIAWMSLSIFVESSQSYIHAGEVLILKRERENQYSLSAQTLARHLSTFILAIKRSRPQTNLLCPDTVPLQHHNALYLHRCLLLCVFTVPTLTSSQGIYSPHVGLFCVFRWCHLLCGLVRLRGSNIGWPFI